jgi:hypothetical protein
VKRSIVSARAGLVIGSTIFAGLGVAGVFDSGPTDTDVAVTEGHGFQEGFETPRKRWPLLPMTQLWRPQSNVFLKRQAGNR